VSAVASSRWRLLAAALALAVAVALSACGSEEEPTDEITISATAQPNSLDPALAFDVGALQATWLVYTPLLTYRRDEGEKGAELIPGLASDLPEISDDGRTYTLTLRKGLLYSDGTEVKASDFERAIKRVLTLDSGGAPFYAGIEGAAAYARANDPEAEISGIDADDETGEITIRLAEPDATFANALALVFAAPVPAGTPFRELTADPPPGVGPYEITESDPGNRFVLEQTPNFADLDIPDIPTGNIPRITTEIIGSVTEQVEDVLDNRLDSMQDPPPADLVPEILDRAAGRYTEHPTASTYYFFLNQRLAPFDDPLVREAANWAVDRRALAGLYAGAMEPGCSLLAPGVPGYDERLDTVACPYGFADRDLGRARALIHQAGAEGEPVTVWGSGAPDSRAATEAYAATLQQIGLDARTRLVAPGRYYATINHRRTKAQTGFDTWFEDFPHPLDFFVVVDGDSIQPTNNPNPGDVDDPLVNSEIDRLRTIDDLDSVVADWSRLDRYVVSPPQSYLVPWGHKQVATFFSERMDPDSAIFHPLYRNDYSSWRLKEGE
jgi:peptide/nickel transport system substrate-binding protein